MDIITAENLRKTYRRGRIEALRGVSLALQEGEMFGLIGPDGAGKTTLFRILTTLLLADSGRATVDGLDVVSGYREIRRRIGYMPGRFSLYQDLTVEENLAFFASIFGTDVRQNYHLIRDIYAQIERFGTRRAGALSGGMKQKLALCCALIHAPRVLFLDEPTTGVDPVSRTEFWEMLGRLKQAYGLSILVSTPYMDEAVRCDRIALMQDGAFLQTDAPADIIRSFGQRLWSVRTGRMHALLDDLRAMDGVLTAFSFGESYHVTVAPTLQPDELGARLRSLGHAEVSIEPAEPCIEDCFMSLTQTEK